MSVTREVRIDLEGIQRLLESFDPSIMEPAAKRGMERGIQIVARRAVQSQMSAPKRGSRLFQLGVDTGTARRSIATKVEQGGGVTRGIFGSPLRYVRAHEMGFSGEVKVRAHVRRLRGRASSKRAARSLDAFYVRAHKRQVNMRGLFFLWAALQAKRGEAIDGVAREIFRAAQGAANA